LEIAKSLLLTFVLAPGGTYVPASPLKKITSCVHIPAP
jgi:hypothetical protein